MIWLGFVWETLAWKRLLAGFIEITIIHYGNFDGNCLGYLVLRMHLLELWKFMVYNIREDTHAFKF